MLPTPWARMPSVAAYLVDAEPLTLIDAGIDDDASFAALEAGLDELGHTPGDVKRVALTHYHVDHLGGVGALRRRGVDFELAAHSEAVQSIEHFTVEHSEDMEGMEALLRDYGVPEDVRATFVAHRRSRLEVQPSWAEATSVERALHDGDGLDFKDFSLEVIHAPGHTAGHVVFQNRGTGTLISGDTIMSGAVPHTENYYLEGLPEPDDPARRHPRFKGLLAYRNSLRRLKREPDTLPERVAATGAGPHETAAARDDAARIAAALATLPDEQREVVVMRVYGRLKFREIAEALSLSINTAQSRHRYALEALRERLAR